MSLIPGIYAFLDLVNFFFYFRRLTNFKSLWGRAMTVMLEAMYSARNHEMSIRFSLKFRPSERFHRPEMSQIKAEISLRTNVKLICHKNVGLQWYQWIPDFYNIRFWANLFNGKKLCGLKSYVIKIRESIDIIAILHFYEKLTSRWYEGWSQLSFEKFLAYEIVQTAEI